MNQGNITDDGSQPHRYDVWLKKILIISNLKKTSFGLIN